MTMNFNTFSLKSITIAFVMLVIINICIYYVNQQPKEMTITFDTAACTDMTQSGIDCYGTLTQ